MASLCGKSHQAVAKWTNHPDWPVSRRPPWTMADLAEINAFRRVSLERDPAGEYRRDAAAAAAGTGEMARLTPLTRVRIQAYGERALLTRRKREMLEGTLMKREEHDRLEAAMANAFRSNLEPLPRAISASLVNQDQATIERLLSDRVREILEAVANAALNA